MLSNKKSHSIQQSHQDESKLVNSIVQLRLLWGKHLQSQWKHHRIAFALLSIRDSKEISSMFHLDRLSHQLPVAFVTSLKDRRLKPDFPENFNRTLWQVAWSCGGNIKPWQYFLSHNAMLSPPENKSHGPWPLASSPTVNQRPVIARLRREVLQDVLFVWSKIKITFVFMFLRPKYQHLAYVGSDQGGPKFSSSHPVFVVEAPHLVNMRDLQNFQLQHRSMSAPSV